MEKEEWRFSMEMFCRRKKQKMQLIEGRRPFEDYNVMAAEKLPSPVTAAETQQHAFFLRMEQEGKIRSLEKNMADANKGKTEEKKKEKKEKKEKKRGQNLLPVQEEEKQRKKTRKKN